MPIIIDPGGLILAAIKKVIERGIEQATFTFIEDFDSLVKELWDAFPLHPFRMIDAMLRFGTSVAGRILTIPFAGIEGLLLDLLRIAKLHNRVMTTTQAVQLVVRSLGEVVTNLTGTSQSGLLETVLRSAARWVWRVWRHIAFLRAATRWTDEASIIRYFTTKLAKGAKFYGVVLFAIAIFSVIAWTGAIAVLIGLALSVASGTFQDHILAQDSKRVWKKAKGRVARENARRGPDR